MKCRFCGCSLTGTEEQEGICFDCTQEKEEQVEATDQNRFLSKAKTIPEGEWVEGYYYTQLIKVFDLNTNKFLKEKQRCHYIIPVDGETEPSEIDPSTLCQCTTLPDITGQLIFEHDKLQLELFGNPIVTVAYIEKDGCWGMIHDDFVKTVQRYKRLTSKVIKQTKATIVGNEYDLMRS